MTPQGSPRTVAALYCRRDSPYKMLPGVDVWDADRDARLYIGNAPVVAHPPCRLWGQLRHMATGRPDEKELAVHAVRMVRLYGGVLEHPARSTLWLAQALPEPGSRDTRGGFTLTVDQWWWGHEAHKPTRLYVCGLEPRDVPEIPYRIGYAEKCVGTGHGLRAGHPLYRKCLSVKKREATPVRLAEWLVELARRTHRPA